MPFNRPTLPQLVQRNQTSIESRLQGTDAMLRRNLCNILARMDAGQAHGLYGYLDWLAEQLFPDSAEYEFLQRHGNFWEVYERGETHAAGAVTATGTPDSVIPAGAVWQRSDGAEYAVDEDTRIPAGGSVSVPVTCLAPGKNGNADAGVRAQLTSPVLGAVAQGVSSQGFTGGTDGEGVPSFRGRILQRVRKKARGGNDDDYKFWAQEVPGVTRVWVYRKEMGAGTVVVRAMMDGTYPDGIPRADDTARLQAHLETRRPVPAEVFAVAPIAAPLNMRLTVSPDTPAIRAAVEASLKSAIIRDAEPGKPLLVSRLREAVSVAAGEYDHVLLFPPSNVPHATGHIAIPGDIAWEEA